MAECIDGIGDIREDIHTKAQHLEEVLRIVDGETSMYNYVYTMGAGMLDEIITPFIQAHRDEFYEWISAERIRILRDKVCKQIAIRQRTIRMLTEYKNEPDQDEDTREVCDEKIERAKTELPDYEDQLRILSDNELSASARLALWKAAVNSEDVKI